VSGRNGSRPAVFLDRDGVLNEVHLQNGRPHPPSGVDAVELRPGVVDACRRLRDEGLLLVMVTNQPDISRGTTTWDTVRDINERLRSELGLHDVRVCPHDDPHGCGCRKPSAGLLLDAARERGIDLASSVMVGDRWRDVEAGRRAGCRTVLVQAGHDDGGPEGAADLVVESLGQAVPWILHRTGRVLTDAAQLRVKVFADGADAATMLALAEQPDVKGFTTNPTLMRAAGVADYARFAAEVLEVITEHPISFEVFADDLPEMARQARLISGWAGNVYVKIPVTNTQGESTAELVQALSHDGVRVNVTALMSTAQVATVVQALAGGAPSCVSLFAGRIAAAARAPRRRHPGAAPADGADLGQSARAAQHRAGARGGLPHHHRHRRPAQEAAAAGPRPRRVLARHGADVPARRDGLRLHPVILGRPAPGTPG
jgi:histidinol-phosphate phosphatase family protein